MRYEAFKRKMQTANQFDGLYLCLAAISTSVCLCDNEVVIERGSYEKIIINTDSNTLIINGKEQAIQAPIIEKNEDVLLPSTELADELGYEMKEEKNERSR